MMVQGERRDRSRERHAMEGEAGLQAQQGSRSAAACSWVSGEAANAGAGMARLDLERSMDCAAKKPLGNKLIAAVMN